MANVHGRTHVDGSSTVTDHSIVVRPILRGNDIGLEEIGDGIWEHLYDIRLLGKIDERSLQITGSK
jgi:hypothetical protein